MIKEIYIDNFRCLTNFKIEPGDCQLWLGDNGSGKTSVLDALRNIQGLQRGERIDDIFSSKSLTAWDRRLEQTIGITLDIDGDMYKYNLVVQHFPHGDGTRIKREELKWRDLTFFLFDGRNANVYRINRKTEKYKEETSFAADWSRSIIPTIAPREDKHPLLRFREEIERWLLIHPVPLVVKQLALSEAKNLTTHAENFAQWYRHLLQEKPNIGYMARQYLADVLPGFQELSLKGVGEGRRLTANFQIECMYHDFDFMDISDGQRQLIVLYTILEAFRAGTISTLFIDEPDNFVSLREIQPWLDGLNDICDDENRQAIIISHHPEIINKMARGKEAWFSRKEGAHTLVKPYPVKANLTPAETMARGWEDE